MNEVNIALIGIPNSGKTTLFNTLTGKKQKIANFPGVTVDVAVGEMDKEGDKYSVYDMPGLYNLEPLSLDEKITRDAIKTGKIHGHEVTHFYLVINANNIERSLYLLNQVCKVNKITHTNVTVILNNYEYYKEQGLELSFQTLESFLKESDIDYISLNAQDKKEVSVLKKFEHFTPVEKDEQKVNELFSSFSHIDEIQKSLAEVEELEKSLILKKRKANTTSEKVDRILLSPKYGLLISLFILFVLFQVLYYAAGPVMDLIDSTLGVLSTFLSAYITNEMFKSLLVDGIIAGVGGIIVFVPHIFLMFFLIGLLEGSGYLTRLAFILDFLMKRVGLSGRAVIPLLSSHACAIPGIMSARILAHKRERLLTTMLSPLMTCSARLPVYAVLIAAISSQYENSYINLGGALLFSLYLAPIIISFIISFFTTRFVKQSSTHQLMIELPEYSMPNFKMISINSLDKAILFVKKAGTIILFFTVVMWGLLHFPQNSEKFAEVDIEQSYAATIGKSLSPIFEPLGFDWRITTALLPSFAAREVMVSSMATVLKAESENEESLAVLIGSDFSLAMMASLLVWFMFAPQCVSTFAVIKKETQGYLYPTIFSVYTLVLAYGLSFLTFQMLS